MKTIKLFVLVLFATFALSVSAQTLVLPSSLPIYSPNVLMSYLKQNVQRASSTVTSPGMVDSPYLQTTFWIYTTDANPLLDALARIQGQPLTWNLVDPAHDVVSLSVWFYDTNGYPIFGGGNSGYMKYNGNYWYLPGEVMSFDIVFAGQAPISVPGVVQAKVNLRGENGEIIQSYYLDIDYERGLILFPSYLAKRFGEVIVTLSDGQSMGYSLYENAQVRPTFGWAFLNLSVEGFYPFAENSRYIYVTPNSQGGQGKPPLIEEKVTQPMSVSVFVETTEGEQPIGYWVRDIQDDSDGAWHFVPAIEGYNTQIYFDHSATYNIAPEFENFGRQVNYWWDGRG